MIFTAASHAQRAADDLNGLQVSQIAGGRGMSRAQVQGGQLGFDALLSAAANENRKRKVERETAHLPGTVAVPFYRLLIRQHHAAMTAARQTAAAPVPWKDAGASLRSSKRGSACHGRSVAARATAAS